MTKINYLRKISESEKPFIIYKSDKGFDLYTDFSKRISAYKGLTGNINIAAFSIVIKLPLLIYRSITSKNRTYLFNLLLFLSAFVVIHLHKTRGAILTIILLILGVIAFLAYQRISNKTFNKKTIYLT
mgnify:CR=1 FL=1